MYYKELTAALSKMLALTWNGAEMCWPR